MRTINRILVANRGEIALRVCRTATDMGISTIAVYADQDMAAPHTREADEALALGGDDAASTYLNGEKILAIAIETGADAIHPGYGFLSENSEFARAVEDAGIAWLGPSSAVIDALGDKIKARLVAEACGVSPVPGVSQPVTSRTEVEAFIEEAGYPVVLKRADGGGGRGITVVRSTSDLDLFFARHGDSADLGAHFVERFVEVARHVETQCARDALGNFHVISTRDCSVGTVEFLLEPDGSIWFLEVNPRLQVEHPVSEEVTGIDLVREQIRIAQGLALTTPPAPRGHSFEFRITSEDPSQDLTPTAGRLDEVHWPLGPGIRLELGIDEGDTVQTAFDSMIAKIIVTGADREQALARSRRALAEFSVQGVATPVPVYQDIISDPDFCGVGGFNVSTRWFETSFMPRHDYSNLAIPAEASQTADLPRQTYIIELDGRRVSLTLPAGMFNAPAAPAPRPPQPLRSTPRRAGSLSPHSGPHQGAPGDIVAPMQAIVVALAVSEGQRVEEGQLVAVLEAMKMEKPLLAPRAGTVESLAVRQGDTVSAGTRIAHISTEEAQ